jgi:hypothetical protein
MPIYCISMASQVGGSWVEVPAGKYTRAQERDKKTYCQIEAHVHYKNLITHAPEGEQCSTLQQYLVDQPHHKQLQSDDG